MKRLFNKVPRVSKKFKHFDFSIKNPKSKSVLPKSKSTATKAIDTLTSKKALAAMAGAAIVTGGSIYVNNYIDENSGCFLYENGEPHCKIKELSCCQPNPIDTLPFCNLNVDAKICDGFDEEDEGSCCKLCDCAYHDCLPNQSMKCRRPTYAEALTYLSDSVTENLLGFKLFGNLKYILPCLGILVAAVILWKLV